MPPTTDSRPVAPPPSWTPPPPARRSSAGLLIGLALVGVGIVALLATLGVDLPLPVLGAVLLVVLGIGLVVSAVTGEPSGGALGFAVVLGILLALGAVAGTFLNVPVTGGVGQQVHRPTAAAELEDSYRLLAGELELDLSEVELGPGTTEVEASTVLGQVRVRLPDDVPVSVDTGVAGGTASVLGTVQEGLSVDNDVTSEDWTGADRRLLLRATVGLGEVQVTR